MNRKVKVRMSMRSHLLFLGLVAAWPCLSAEEVKKDSVVEPQILGEVPEGWQVVELHDASPIEKWVKLKNGEERKLLLKPYGLQPVSSEETQFTVVDPLKTSTGQKLDAVLDTQNENLAESEIELSTMLARLKQLLGSLPNQTQDEKSS